MISKNQTENELPCEDDFVHEKLFEHEQKIDLIMEAQNVLLKLMKMLMDEERQGRR